MNIEALLSSVVRGRPGKNSFGPTPCAAGLGSISGDGLSPGQARVARRLRDLVTRISKNQQHIIADWILAEGRKLAEASAFFDGLNAAFTRAGVPVERAMFSLLVIHPQAAAAGFEWRSDTPTIEIARERSV